MPLANHPFQGKTTLNLTLATMGALLSLTPLVNAAQMTASSFPINQQSLSEKLETNRSDLIAQSSVCPENSGGSQFVTAETNNFFVYICGGDLPNTYVGVAKNRNRGGIILPLRSYTNDRFVAVNGSVRYTLTRNELIVTQNGRVILRERATWKW